MLQLHYQTWLEKSPPETIRSIENDELPAEDGHAIGQVFGFDHPIHGNREVAYDQGPKRANSG
jgi:hypothetical protein